MTTILTGREAKFLAVSKKEWTTVAEDIIGLLMIILVSVEIGIVATVATELL